MLPQQQGDSLATELALRSAGQVRAAQRSAALHGATWALVVCAVILLVTTVVLLVTTHDGGVQGIARGWMLTSPRSSSSQTRARL